MHHSDSFIASVSGSRLFYRQRHARRGRETIKFTWLILAFVLLASIGNVARSQNRYGQQQQPQWQPNAYMEREIREFVPKHPWRAIDGTTNYVKLDGVEFIGKIVDISPDGVIINGTYGPLFRTFYAPSVYQYSDYFVAHFPFEVENDQTLSRNEHLMAWDTGHTYTYTTVRGSSRTIHKLDYGIPCGIPAELLQQQAAIAKANAERAARRAAEGRTNTFIWLQQQSTNGDASVQYRLGLHYLNGDGCATNRVEAVKWFTIAADRGSVEASNKLETLKP